MTAAFAEIGEESFCEVHPIPCISQTTLCAFPKTWMTFLVIVSVHPVRLDLSQVLDVGLVDGVEEGIIRS